MTVRGFRVDWLQFEQIAGLSSREVAGNGVEIVVEVCANKTTVGCHGVLKDRVASVAALVGCCCFLGDIEIGGWRAKRRSSSEEE